MTKYDVVVGMPVVNVVVVVDVAEVVLELVRVVVLVLLVLVVVVVMVLVAEVVLVLVDNVVVVVVELVVLVTVVEEVVGGTDVDVTDVLVVTVVQRIGNVWGVSAMAHESPTPADSCRWAVETACCPCVSTARKTSRKNEANAILRSSVSTCATSLLGARSPETSNSRWPPLLHGVEKMLLHPAKHALRTPKLMISGEDGKFASSVSWGPNQPCDIARHHL